MHNRLLLMRERPYGVRQHSGRSADAREKNGSTLQCGIHLPSPLTPILYQKHGLVYAGGRFVDAWGNWLVSSDVRHETKDASNVSRLEPIIHHHSLAWVLTMPFPVLHRSGVVGVGVAVANRHLSQRPRCQSPLSPTLPCYCLPYDAARSVIAPYRFLAARLESAPYQFPLSSPLSTNTRS